MILSYVIGVYVYNGVTASKFILYKGRPDSDGFMKWGSDYVRPGIMGQLALYTNKNTLLL